MSLAVSKIQNPAPLVPPGEWEIDIARSLIAFEVRHLKLAKARGRFHRFDGHISCNRDGAAEIAGRVAVASIETGDDRRDARMRTAQFFDADRFPFMSFEGVGYADEVRGALTIRDVTREVVLAVAPEPAGPGTVRIAAEGYVSRRDFGLDWDPAFTAGGLVLDDRVRMKFDVVATRAGATRR